MFSCGLQCINCDYPVHMDTYVGCTHNCKYCYKTARSNHIAGNFNDIKPRSRVPKGYEGDKKVKSGVRKKAKIQCCEKA